MKLAPKFYFGQVWHKRAAPVQNEFRYPVFFLKVMRSSLRSAPNGNWFVGVNRSALLSIWSKDHHLGSDPIEQVLNERFGEEDLSLYCFPRVFGYQFKPISFWLGKQAVLAEVHNTFGEQHGYVFERQSSKGIQKKFHVSPFCQVRGCYDFDIRETANSFAARIHYREMTSGQERAEERVESILDTTWVGSYEPNQAKALSKALLQFPFASLLIVARIHWQAFRLWRAKLPFFSKPAPPQHSLSGQN